MNATHDFIRSWKPFRVPPAPGAVYVWCLHVDRDFGMVLPFYALLDQAERRRADRFRFECDAVCFILTRAHLRLILASALSIDAAAVRFTHQTTGKPRIEGEGGPWFNVSHSGGIALMAIASDRRVGVDIERIRPIVDHDPAMYFSQEEVRDLKRLPEQQRERAFFRGWTRKEAYLKARGDGLGFGLQNFSVALAPDLPPRLLHVDGYPEEPSLWDFWDLTVDPAFSVSLVAETPINTDFRGAPTFRVI
ncbi:4'-phosphopantetheinyl transferase superfamily protein [archaeon]|nr:MAG: 4'-phosphopantetheinyl transferase superfamily protein [archaeon]